MNEPVIIDGDRLEAVETEWTDLWSDTLQRSPLLAWDHIKLWYSCFASPSEVRVYRVAVDDELLGFLPLVLRDRVLSSLSNDHCMYSEPLVVPGKESEFQRQVISVLSDDCSSWDMLNYRFSYSFSICTGLADDQTLSSASLRFTRETQPTYTIALDGPVEDYFDSLGKNARKTIRGARNRVKKAGAHSYLTYLGREAAEQWHRFTEVEGSGWKGREGTSIELESEAYQRYYDGLVRLLAEKDDLRLYFLELEGETIAGGFGFVSGDNYQFAKSGYLEKHRDLSPSVLLLLHMYADIQENLPEVRRLHFFPWSYGYKDRYCSNADTCIDTTIYSPTARGAIRAGLSQARNFAKRVPGLKAMAELLRRGRGGD